MHRKGHPPVLSLRPQHAAGESLPCPLPSIGHDPLTENRDKDKRPFKNEKASHTKTFTGETPPGEKNPILEPAIRFYKVYGVDNTEQGQ